MYVQCNNSLFSNDWTAGRSRRKSAHLVCSKLHFTTLSNLGLSDVVPAQRKMRRVASLVSNIRKNGSEMRAYVAQRIQDGNSQRF